jgi:hypothetical protein
MSINIQANTATMTVSVTDSKDEEHSLDYWMEEPPKLTPEEERKQMLMLLKRNGLLSPCEYLEYLRLFEDDNKNYEDDEDDKEVERITDTLLQQLSERCLNALVLRETKTCVHVLFRDGRGANTLSVYVPWYNREQYTFIFEVLLLDSANNTVYNEALDYVDSDDKEIEGIDCLIAEIERLTLYFS